MWLSIHWCTLSKITRPIVAKPSKISSVVSADWHINQLLNQKQSSYTNKSKRMSYNMLQKQDYKK